MLTLADVRAAPARVYELGGADVLIAAASDAEVVLRPPYRAEATMIFEHETIRMMRAERVAELEKLKRQLGPESVMIPIRKKSGSFWDQVTIGRGTVNDIVLGDPAVSTLHAHFEVASNGEVSVRDLDSSNGTFVNRTPLQPHKLTVLGAGDCIRFGQTVFYYVTAAMLHDLLK